MKILAIGAHYDDVELGCGGTLLKCNKLGYENHVLVITQSEYAKYNGTLLRSKEEASKEGTTSCKFMRARLWNLMLETKKVECNTELIENIERIVDRINPDIIFTHWYGDLHEDHYEVARASIVATRHYKSVLTYRSNWYHSGVVFDGRIYVDISDEMNDKIKLLKLHETELKRRGDDWIHFMESRAKEAGLRMGVKYAEEFQVIKFLWRI